MAQRRNGVGLGGRALVDVSLIAGAITGLRTAASMANDLVAIRDHAVLQAKVIDLQRTILDAQSSALAAQGQQQDLLDQIRSLNQQLEQATAWESLKARYELIELGDKSFAYRLREAHRSEEPDHILCSKCFGDRRLSILNFAFSHNKDFYWDCPTCRFRYELRGRI